MAFMVGAGRVNACVWAALSAPFLCAPVQTVLTCFLASLLTLASRFSRRLLSRYKARLRVKWGLLPDCCYSICLSASQTVNSKRDLWLNLIPHHHRLCGSSDAARCQNSGCHYNSIYQWTNEPCEPGDEGYECTTP